MLKMTKTIGFFGDSFCAESYNHHSIFYNYKTYIQLLANHYDAKIVNLGHGGTSVWDTLLVQLNPLIDKQQVPDICVFVWTIPGRLFSRKIRRLNSTDVKVKKRFRHRKVWEAAEQFYDHLYDREKEELEHIAILRYIDQIVLPKLPDTTKIVHLWTAGNTLRWDIDGIRPANTTYPYTWTHGSEVRPSLLAISMYDNDMSVLSTDHRCNHLDGDFKNKLVFDWIKLAIDNPNSIWDYTKVLDRFFDKS
jgi:hypothetical protein